ncbi:hypothetical protein ABZ605_27715 [Streptomyces sp. NPDC012765]|uniref:hypothetical protein n=1 Tax=Streptomyces sp. NPDC012765 TaxID=3155249 RepID=UPI0033FDD03B
MSRRPHKDPALEPVNGIVPQITETDGLHVLSCPLCGPVGAPYRFRLLARRAFEAHADEEHPTGPGPLERIRTLVDLAEGEPGTWQCLVGEQRYVVSRPGPDHYEVEIGGRRATLHGRLTTLDAVRIAIGGYAGLVDQALATAAAIEAQRGEPGPGNTVSLA